VNLSDVHNGPAVEQLAIVKALHVAAYVLSYGAELNGVVWSSCNFLIISRSSAVVGPCGSVGIAAATGSAALAAMTLARTFRLLLTASSSRFVALILGFTARLRRLSSLGGSSDLRPGVFLNQPIMGNSRYANYRQAVYTTPALEYWIALVFGFPVSSRNDIAAAIIAELPCEAQS
jgi:hypothetical protein